MPASWETLARTKVLNQLSIDYFLDLAGVTFADVLAGGVCSFST
jgi:hypothetical protein